MASADYGAVVYRDDARLPNIDASIRGLEYFALHAVLGEGPVRFAIQKSRPLLFLRGTLVSVDHFKSNQSIIGNAYDEDDRDEQHYEGWLMFEGERYYLEAVQWDGTMCDIRLVEPDGTAWTARGGYGFQPGYEQWDMYDHTPWSTYDVSLPD